jgi:hypothetical protein
LFSLQENVVQGAVKILVDGTSVTFIQDYDQSNYASITGTCIVALQLGQKVSDSLLFYVA